MKMYARAKINLTLYVTGRRDNGYHDLELIFQPVSLADELDIEPNESGELKFTCSIPEFENDSNLVVKGYRALKELFPDKVGGLNIHLTKHIPSGAGMGGGSTDCSVLLVWMNKYFGLGLGRRQLIGIGAKLGADVPACMFNHATLGQGIGDVLKDIEMHRDYPLLLIKPASSFNTGEMYRRVDERADEARMGGVMPGWENEAKELVGCGCLGLTIAASAAKIPNTLGMIRAMERGDLESIGDHLQNIFEDAIPGAELVADLKARLKKTGALGSLMTGSGSVVYGIFDDETSRDQAYEALKDLPDCEVICCQAVNHWGEEEEYSFL